MKDELLARTLAAPLHRRLVAGRRVRALARAVRALLPEEPGPGLDVGCGSGEVAAQVGVDFEGCDVLVRPTTFIPVRAFDGLHLPYPDASFDFALLIDVLHHLDEPLLLLREARRVSRRCVILKDHLCESAWDRGVLRFMDWVGNRAHGVALPYNYLSGARWTELFAQAGLKVEARSERLGLYPLPFAWLFEARLHFMARLAGNC